jgi:hypothetical protein
MWDSAGCAPNRPEVNMADLTSARNKSLVLRSNLPRRAGQVVDVLQSIRNDLEAPGPDVLPEHGLEILTGKVDGLLKKVEDRYHDREDRVEEEVLFESVVDFDATLEALRTHLIESPVYKDFVRLLTRIDSILPTSAFDFTSQIEHLRHENEKYEKEWTPSARDRIGDEALNSLAESLEKFRGRHYEDALRCASQTNQLLIENALRYLATAFPNPTPLKSLHDGRQRLWNVTGNAGRSRLEWVVVALAEVSECVRNCVEHPENDSGTPGWMIQRRGLLRRDPCMARLVLICQLCLAIELHQLWQNEASGAEP